jgi:hypothetical protein
MKDNAPSFPFNTSTSTLPKTKLHHEGNLMHTNFFSTMKDNISTMEFLAIALRDEGKLEQEQVHRQRLHCIMKESTSTFPKKHCTINES